jgi:RecA-family ATPase
MRSLTQHLYRGTGTSQLLPDIHPALAEATVRVRRGQMLMLTATAGGGKSLLALWYTAVRNPGRVLYFSLDTSLNDMVKRAAAMLSGMSVQEIEDALESGADDYVADIVAPINERIRWCTKARDMQDIDEEIQAYEEMYGALPDVIVIDVLLNLDGSEEWGGAMHVMEQLHALAHERDVTVLVLHHNSDKRADTTRPSPRSDALFKVSQYPEIMLSMALDQERQVMNISAVKNRSGRADPDAANPVTIPVDLESMRVFLTDQEALAFRKKKEWT